MQSAKGLLGVESSEVLAVIARENGYAAYLKFDVMGELNGFRQLDDEDVNDLVAEGVVVVDARNLEEGDRSRLAYLNTVSPQTDAANGPAGKHHRAPVEFWLSVMNAVGAKIYNADVMPLASSMFTNEYANRLRSEGIDIIEDGMFSIPKEEEFASVRQLVDNIDNVNMEARMVRDGERVVTEMKNLVKGEAIIAKYKGLSGQTAISRSAEKLADRIDNVKKTIEKVPVLKEKLPLNTIFETAKLINEAVKVEPAAKPRPSELSLG